MQEFERLVSLMAQLRAPTGCAWDIAQTHESLRPCLVEESGEVLAAIENSDAHNLREELGDLLLQIVFHAQIASENGDFRLEDVCREISDKLVRRHPHVFGDAVTLTADAVVNSWESIKKQEKLARGENCGGVLSGIAPSLPALAAAAKISKKAARVGFEWENEEGVWEKIAEELAELRQARNQSPQRFSEELGDVFFTLVNLARWQKVDPEMALRDCNTRFRRRFEHMERAARAREIQLDSLSPREWDALWNEAKAEI